MAPFWTNCSDGKDLGVSELRGSDPGEEEWLAAGRRLPAAPVVSAISRPSSPRPPISGSSLPGSTLAAGNTLLGAVDTSPPLAARVARSLPPSGPSAVSTPERSTQRPAGPRPRPLPQPPLPFLPSPRRPSTPSTLRSRRKYIPEVAEEVEPLAATIQRLDLDIATSGHQLSPFRPRMAHSITSDSPTNTSGAPLINRQGQPLATVQTRNGMNGNEPSGSMANPMTHQHDINFLFRQMQELGEILRANRDKVAGITLTAEEVMNRASNGIVPESTEGPEVNGENVLSSAAQIRKLETDLLKANRVIDILKDEQTQNTELIGKYELALGATTEQIRTYCTDNNSNYLSQRQHYNSLLQAEKDEHLQSRLDRDYWQAQALKVCGMIREAHRLRSDEFGDEIRVISGLQSEVRVLRKVLGMDVENPEDETGWPFMKDAAMNGMDEA